MYINVHVCHREYVNVKQCALQHKFSEVSDCAQACVKRRVFNPALNCPRLMHDEQSCDGSAFQTVGLNMETPSAELCSCRRDTSTSMANISKLSQFMWPTKMFSQVAWTCMKLVCCHWHDTSFHTQQQNFCCSNCFIYMKAALPYKSNVTRSQRKRTEKEKEIRWSTMNKCYR